MTAVHWFPVELFTNLIHHSTQPLLIFNRENPQFFKLPNSVRRGLDYIALQQTYEMKNSPSEMIPNHCGGMLSAKKYSNLTTSWRFEKNENGNFSAFQHLSWVVMCCLCTLQTTVLRIVNFLSKYDNFFTTAKELKTILSRNGLVIKVFQFHSFLSKNSRTHSMTMGNLNKSKETTPTTTTVLKVAS